MRKRPRLFREKQRGMNKEMVAGEILLELKGLRERLTVLEQRLSEFLDDDAPVQPRPVVAETPQPKPVVAEVAQPEPVVTETPQPGPEKPQPKPEAPKPADRKAPTDGRLISNLHRAIGLNDRFRFRKDLFGGDDQLMNETIGAIDAMGSLADVLAYIGQRFDWDEEDETVRYLMDMLRRRFPD
ncbi:MAG: hypothetical protein J6Y77_05780 [Paludibacteraceae bacterium]|nr:hypothetical protein [Paludibacteraceae bacterium]